MDYIYALRIIFAPDARTQLLWGWYGILRDATSLWYRRLGVEKKYF